MIEKSEITRSQTFSQQIKGLQQAVSQKHNELPVKIDVLENFISKLDCELHQMVFNEEQKTDFKLNQLKEYVEK